MGVWSLVNLSGKTFIAAHPYNVGYTTIRRYCGLSNEASAKPGKPKRPGLHALIRKPQYSNEERLDH
jgi:hypothetical protein